MFPMLPTKLVEHGDFQKASTMEHTNTHIWKCFPIRMVRKTCVQLIIILTICVPICYFNFLWTQRNFSEEEYEASIQVSCQHPELNLWDPEIRTHFKKGLPIRCDTEKEWICINKSEASLCNWTRVEHRNAVCTLTFLKRVSDQYPPEEDTKMKLTSQQAVKLMSDFFHVTCTDDISHQWSNIYAGVRSDPSIHRRIGWEHISEDAMKLNVLMWGFDSLSRLTFIRKLPETYKYLTKHLQSLVLEGYNIVGDGTPQALIPILTGKTELELPETRKRMKFFANFVNIYPFVWNEFRNSGYATAFAEDRSEIGAFTYRLKGFDQQPTDHYMRTFYQAAEQEYYQHPVLCLRSTPRHQVLMNWVKQLFSVYNNKPKFIFTFHNELSHDDYNMIGAADEDLTNFLRFLKDKNHLNDTILIIMSDHGNRFANFRETQQGKQEERLPFFSFTFPPWFPKKYPNAYKNFQTNVKRLTSPFDIHATLRSILNFTGAKMGNLRNRSISLFNEIPQNRTCENAGIEPHWCACLRMVKSALNDTTVVKAARKVVDFINNLTRQSRSLCELLQLKSILRAEMFIPTRDMLKFKTNADYDGFQPDLSSRTKISVKTYQVKIETIPGKSHFEATLTFNVKNQKFTIKESDISRTNKYGSASWCIVNTQQHLRPYCYCKNQAVTAH